MGPKVIVIIHLRPSAVGCHRIDEVVVVHLQALRAGIVDVRSADLLDSCYVLANLVLCLSAKSRMKLFNGIQVSLVNRREVIRLVVQGFHHCINHRFANKAIHKLHFRNHRFHPFRYRSFSLVFIRWCIGGPFLCTITVSFRLKLTVLIIPMFLCRIPSFSVGGA